MSFFSTILDLGKTAIGFLTGNSIASNLARTVLTGVALNQITKSMLKGNDAAKPGNQPAKQDPGQYIVIPPNQNNRIPVLYGEAFVPGIITDAHLNADQTVMTYVMTLCEQTGVKLSTDTNTGYTFEDVYLNDQRVVFKADGVTVDYTLDRNGNQDLSLRDLVSIRFYAGGSQAGYQLSQDGASPVTPVNAWDIVPTWTPFHQMNALIFAVIVVTYNAEKGLRGVPNALFHVISDMTQPGDVLYDYVTNTRYGAGIAPEDIYDE